MKYGAFFLLKFIKKENLLTEYLNEFNSYHRVSFREKELYDYLKTSNDVRHELMLRDYPCNDILPYTMYGGFASYTLSFSWNHTISSSFEFWAEKNDRFKAYINQEFEKIFLSKYPGNSFIDFFISLLEEKKLTSLYINSMDKPNIETAIEYALKHNIPKYPYKYKMNKNLLLFADFQGYGFKRHFSTALPYKERYTFLEATKFFKNKISNLFDIPLL